MVLNRVGVGSVAKVCGVLYAAMGLIIGGLFSLVAMFAGAAAMAGSEVNPLAGMLFGVGAIVAFPIFYGLVGVIAGALSAALYNLIAGTIGGIELELEERHRAG